MPFPLIFVIAFAIGRSRSLFIKKESIAASFAAAPVDRLERYLDSLRMEMIYSQELSLTDSQEITTAASDSLSSTDTLALYHRRMVQVRAVCSLLHHSAAFDI